jgi:hypothetical protein
MSQQKNTKPMYSVDGHGDVYITYSDTSDINISKDLSTDISLGDLSIVNEQFRHINLSQLEDMCDRYPSVGTAFEKFKNVYNLCVDEYNRNNHTNLSRL